MANALFVKGAERMLAAALAGTAPVAGTLKAALMADTYAPSLSADEFYSGISAHVLDTPEALVSVVFTGGKLDAADATFAAVAPGATAEAIVLYMDTGNPATSWLFAYIDTATGLPVATNGGDVVVQWDNGTYRIVSLV